MASENLNITVTAELAQFRKSMQDLGTLGKQEISDMVRGMQRSLKQAEKAAKDAREEVDNIGRAADHAGRAAERSLGMIGGAFGDLADIAFDIVPAITGAGAALGSMGAAAATAAGLIVGGLAVGTAAYSALQGIVELAQDAEQQLTDAGLAAHIPVESQIALDAYQRSQDELATATSLLLLNLTGDSGLVAAMTGLNKIAKELIGNTGTLVGWVQGFVGTILDMNEALAPLVSAWNPVIGAMMLGAGQTDNLYDALVRLGEYNTDLAGILDTTANRFRVTEEEIAAAAALLGTGSTSGGLSYGEAVEQATAQTGQFGALLIDDLASAASIARAAVRDTADAIDQDLSKALTDGAAKITAMRKAMGTLGNASLQIAGNVADGIIAIEDGIIEGYERRLAAGEELNAKEVQALKRAYALKKAAALAQITVSALEAYVAMTAGLASTLGPLAWSAPIIAAGIVGTSIIAPVAQVLGDSPDLGNIGNVSGGGSFSGSPTASGGGGGSGTTLTDAEKYSEMQDYYGGGDPAHYGTAAKIRDANAFLLTVDPNLRKLTVTSDPPGKSWRGRR